MNPFKRKLTLKDASNAQIALPSQTRANPSDRPEMRVKMSTRINSLLSAITKKNLFPKQDPMRRRSRVVRALKLQSEGVVFKSLPDRYLDFLTVVPSSDPWPRL